MVGALVKATGVVRLESLFEPIQHRFGRLAERNVNAMKRAYEETVVKEQKN
jgi:pyruvate ferredoxin oxidoreductase gamma subunit